MVIAGKYFKDKTPFKAVYFTGIVRDHLGRKMSKSLGNSPDINLLMDNYGADTIRLGLLLNNKAGQDFIYTDKILDNAYKFLIKFWNAYQLIQKFKDKIQNNKITNNEELLLNWINNKVSFIYEEINKEVNNLEIDNITWNLYHFFYNDYCSCFLELVKNNKNPSQEFYEGLINNFNNILKLFNPIIPFITEFIYEELNEKKLYNDPFNFSNYNIDIINNFNHIKDLYYYIQDWRNKNNYKKEQILDIYIENENLYFEYKEFIYDLLKLNIIITKDLTNKNISIINDSYSIYQEVNIDKNKIIEDIKYYEEFLDKIEKKLNNSNFRDKANKEIILLEEKKKKDCLEKLTNLRKIIYN